MEINPDISIQNQLAGLGQLRDLRTTPNLQGVDINFLLQQAPRQLEKLLRLGEIEAKAYKEIMKAFEGRDLGKRGKRK